MPDALPTVLHLAVEYNDPHLPRTTKAVQSLVEATGAVNHVVISLRRTASPRAVHFIDCGEIRGVRVFSYRYFGAPLGLSLRRDMREVATRVMSALREHGLQPALVHSHKFTFEGIAGDEIARALEIPHVISVRGEVESKVLRAKPHYRGLYKRIAEDARALFFVSAWYRHEFDRLLGNPGDKAALLPNMVSNARSSIQPTPPHADYVSVMDLTKWRRKGFDNLVRAFGSAGIAPGSRLDIFGKIDDDVRKILSKKLGRLGLSSRVRLLGEVSHDELLQRLPSYRAFLLASFNETFGMAYVEALFAGVPILYSQLTGIDGYLDDFSVGARVAPESVASIRAGIEQLDQSSATLRAEIARHAAGLHDRFGNSTILRTYATSLSGLLDLAPN